jgi:predicted O-methyltransferase YrrM
MHNSIEHPAGRILVLLNEHQPAFQLRSGTTELSSSEAHFAEQGRDTRAIARASYASSDDVLEFLAATIRPDWVTLETGGGRSTCVFSAAAKQHLCINPDRTANELVREFLTRHGVPAAGLEFLSEPSDVALPLLPKDLSVDLALIDGNHSFPLPIIDWHYIDRHLKPGGLLVVDDTHIRSVRLLIDFLATERSYAPDRTIGATSVWRKGSETRVWGWAAQPMNQNRPWKSERLMNMGARLLRRARRTLSNP